MQHVVIRHPGGYDRLVIREAPDLQPQPGCVVVSVSHAGVNYADSIVRMGLYKSARKLRGYPITPGFEFAGRVLQVGKGVRRFSVDQPVFGVTLFNGYASQVSVPEHQLFPLPTKMTASEAASFPAAFLTAWCAASKLGQASQGMNTLVHAAAGGVGGALTQVLRLAGCRVVGVVGSSEKVKVARSGGCAEVIDKSAGAPWVQAERYAENGYDLIFDSIGVATLDQSYRHLAPMGRLITFGFSSMLPRSGKWLNPLALAWDYLRTPHFNPINMADDNRSVMAFNLSFLFERRDILENGMTDLLRWIDEGKIKPLPVTEYALIDVAKAQRDIESGGTTGKLVLRVESQPVHRT